MMWGSVSAIDKTPSLGTKPVELQVEVDATDSFEVSLGAGMRLLYKDALFFDVVLLACGQKFPAHKAVLAATSAPLRQQLEQAVAAAEAAEALENASPLEKAKLPEASTGATVGNAVENPPETEIEKPTASSTTDSSVAQDQMVPAIPAPEASTVGVDVGFRMPEIHLANISCPQAVSILLEHVYGMDGGLSENYSVSDDATNKDVLRLASDLQIPTLKELAMQWMTKDVTSANVILRLSIAQDFALHEFFEGAAGALASDMPALREVTNDLAIVKHPDILQALLMRVATACNSARINKKQGEQRPAKKARTATSGGA
jgi:hypothetical protein